MKTQSAATRKIKQSQSSIKLFLCFFFFIFLQFNFSFAQTPIRGMYVDQFVSYLNNTSTFDPNFSFLGVWDASAYGGTGGYKKENDILEYAAENHVTYLCLYDVGRILGNSTTLLYDSVSVTNKNLEYHLCRFIQKAKTIFCIDKIGIAGASKQFYCDLLGISPCSNAVASPTITSLNSIFPQLLLDEIPFVSDPLQPGDPLFERSEVLKLFLRALQLSVTCSAQIDVLNLEYEYWNTANYGNANGFQHKLADLDKVKSYYNANFYWNK